MGRDVSGRVRSADDAGARVEPWDYTRRVPQGWGPRDIAFAPALLAVVATGGGMFMAHDAAMGRVHFWLNPVVLFGLAHIVFCLAVAAWMFWGRLLWTAPQMGLASMAMLGLPYLIHFASLLSICLYSPAPSISKGALLLLSLAWHVWWVMDVAKKCRLIWADESLHRQVWIVYEPAFVYRQYGAKDAMERVGLRLYPSNWTLIVAFGLVIPLVWWRAELSAHFGVPFIHVFMAMLGGSVGVLGLTFVTVAAVMMLAYPARGTAATGKPVLVDTMTPAGAERPRS